MSLPVPRTRELQGIVFTLLEACTSGQAHFSFSGRFEDTTVTWDTRLFTLTHYHLQQAPEPQALERSPFLEIGALTAVGRTLCVALDIEQIDEPAILRTIIMIRQYKRLQMGRHEFGIKRMFPPRR